MKSYRVFLSLNFLLYFYLSKFIPTVLSTYQRTPCILDITQSVFKNINTERRIREDYIWILITPQLTLFRQLSDCRRFADTIRIRRLMWIWFFKYEWENFWSSYGVSIDSYECLFHIWFLWVRASVQYEGSVSDRGSVWSVKRKRKRLILIYCKWKKLFCFSRLLF